MSEGQDILEIRERLHDFTDALREADGEALARGFEAHEAKFTDPKEVRRAVAAIQGQLRRYRDGALSLPDTPKVEVTANLLEDACQAALAAGVIEAAAPSIRTQATRKVAVVFWALLFGLLVLAVPVGLVMLGFDPTDAHVERTLGPLDLPQGEEHAMSIELLAKSSRPAATTGVEIRAVGGCKGALADGSICGATEPRLWAEGRLPTYELKLPDQAYGLLFSLGNPEIVGDLGKSTLLIAATDHTPEGTYKIPFEAAYVGYTPEQCSVAQRLQRKCVKAKVGELARHEGIAVPSVLVRVVRGDPSMRSGEKRLEKAMAEEARRRAEEQADKLGGAVDAIEGALQETAQLIRKKRWVEAREMVNKLATLFEPIEAAIAQGLNPATMPESLTKVRDSFDEHRDRLDEFENAAFEKAYAVLSAPENASRSEDDLMEKVSRQLRIPVEYLQDIYTARADEIQRRVEAAAAQRQAKVQEELKALEDRCGELPTQSWQMARDWLHAEHPKTRIKLGECLSPRLKPESCWTFECQYEMSVLIAIDQPWQTSRHSVTFNVRHGRVASAFEH